jgi:hypothetical protein
MQVDAAYFVNKRADFFEFGAAQRQQALSPLSFREPENAVWGKEDGVEAGAANTYRHTNREA